MIRRLMLLGACAVSLAGCRAFSPPPQLRPLVAPVTVTPAIDVTDAVSILAGQRQRQAWVAGRGNWTAWNTYARLGRAGDSAVPGLVDFLRHRDRNLRRGAAIGLATVWAQGDPAHVRPSMVRPSFGRGRTNLAVSALAEGLGDVDPQVRCSSAFALGLIGADAEPAVLALAHAASDPVEKVAKQAIVALGRIGPEAAAREEALTSTLKPPKVEVGEQLMELFDEERSLRMRYYVAMALLAVHSQDREFWIPFTQTHVRDGLAGGGDLRSTEWVGYGTPRIIRELKNNDNWKVRRASALALGELAHTSMYARQALREGSADRDPRVRKAIEAALERTLTAAGREF